MWPPFWVCRPSAPPGKSTKTSWVSPPWNPTTAIGSLWRWDIFWRIWSQKSLRKRLATVSTRSRRCSGIRASPFCLPTWTTSWSFPTAPPPSSKSRPPTTMPGTTGFWGSMRSCRNTMSCRAATTWLSWTWTGYSSAVSTATPRRRYLSGMRRKAARESQAA